VLGTDPFSAIDIPVFAARNGFEVLRRVSGGDSLRFTLRKAERNTKMIPGLGLEK
jgi:TusA-related sulfurtransferase